VGFLSTRTVHKRPSSLYTSNLVARISPLTGKINRKLSVSCVHLQANVLTQKFVSDVLYSAAVRHKTQGFSFQSENQSDLDSNAGVYE
jgi:hypothetical protein